MAKGTKHKADWKETTLQVVIDAKRLYCHSMKIMGNEKVFNPKNDFHNVTLIRISELLAETASRTLRSQYRGEVGYNPGSQMVQIAGISYLDEFDHFVKETLREKMYLHYMDDTRTIEAPDADCAAILSKMAGKLAEVGLAFHPRKTRVVTADKGGLFLGFVFRVTPSGKVLMLRDPDKVRDNRRHLRRLAGLVRRGRRTVEDFENCYGCIRACMTEGNSVRLIRNMDNFVNELRREINESQQLPARAA